MTLFPDVVVEFSPSTDPLQEPVWEDITSYLRSFDIDRGRSTELDRAEAGAATIVLDNNDGRFDPSKTDGPYYPNVRPLRRIRIRAFTPVPYEPFTVGLSFVGGSDVLNGSLVFIGLFSGFVEQWALNWRPEPSPTTDATVSVRAVDAFKILAIQFGQQGYAGQSGPLVSAILTDSNIGWPSSDIVIDVGGKDCNTSPADSSVHTLSALQAIDASEGGLFFMSRDGKFTFYNAQHVFLHPPIAGEVWGDEYSENQYQSITVDMNENAIYNEVLVQSSFVGVGGAAIDDVSQEKFIRRRVVIDTILQIPAEMQTRAQEYILQFSLPRQRVTRLEVGVREDADWGSILAKDLLDRIIVRRRPYEGLPGIYQDSVIQGINISSTSRKQWNVTWRLTATPSQNRLTANQAGFETDTSGWVAVTNCSVSRITTGSHPLRSFTASMALTATANGDMSAETTPNTQLSVEPGRAYTGMAAYWITGFGPAEKDIRSDIRWRDSGGSVIATTTGEVFHEDAAVSSSDQNGFTPAYVSGIAPANAVYATLKVNVLSATAAQVHSVDLMGFYDIEEQYVWTPGMG
jgi:hypothetical protein